MAKPSWISLNKSSGTGGGQVNVTASENTSTSSRSGSLTIKTASGLTKIVTLNQEGLTSFFTIKTGSYITFEKNIRANLTKALATCTAHYNGNEYEVFSNANLISGGVPKLQEDIIIGYKAGEVLNFSILLTMSTATGGGELFDVTTSFEVFANGNELTDPIDKYYGAIVGTREPFGAYEVSEDENVVLEFYISSSDF